MAKQRLPYLLVWLGLSVSGCGSADPEAGQLSEAQLPSREQFPPVGAAMQRRCATLDCHGQVGRSLRLYGVGGLRLSTPQNPVVDPLADPTTDLRDSNGLLVQSNDDWGQGPDATTISADGLAPTNSKESALLATVAPGGYTVIVSGVNGATGVALVEVYDLSAPTGP